MKPRKPAPEQPDLLADITRLSRFPQHKNRQPGQFQGTENPRALRLLRALLKQPLTRESADTITGASNGPEEVRKLREQGLELPCYRLGVHDRDGFWTHRGLYALSHRDRPQVARALPRKGGGQATQGTTGEQATTKKAEADHAEG
ncbi:hypothetical protein GL267_002780 [Acidithiobacillus ferrianus]|uniref:Uncharacterized protein n=2 Tax=Acidithiobacillus ferrianus TaxID=2678518 RepID=A0A845UJB6_9PROT|nr:hypothetical protein [Acidithiobacillus ferrianus]NDU43904.1 hypothetical protein [Acidithiobacillus ferrianus]